MKAFQLLRTASMCEESVLALSVYNESLACAIRRGAPLASYSIDRRCLQSYMEHLMSPDTATSVCFTCAQKFPRISGTNSNPIISMKIIKQIDASEQRRRQDPNIENETMGFLGLSKSEATVFFGLRTYCEKYGKMNDDVTLLEDHLEFKDWHVKYMYGSESMTMLCCPEDKFCNNVIPHEENECCVECNVFVCKECALCIYNDKPSLPPAALANDMMIFYAPSVLYTKNVTVMEMLCASVCITSMSTFTLEKKSWQPIFR